MRSVTIGLSVSALILACILGVSIISPSTVSGWIQGVPIFRLSESPIAPTYGTVQTVVDGDTIKLTTGQTIRLLNINTPESVKPQTAPQCFSKEASNWLATVVEGKEIILRYDQEPKDKYNRWLAWIWLTTTPNPVISNSINAELVQLGYAESVSISPNTTHSREFISYEKQARERDLGLWGTCKSV